VGRGVSFYSRRKWLACLDPSLFAVLDDLSVEVAVAAKPTNHKDHFGLAKFGFHYRADLAIDELECPIDAGIEYLAHLGPAQPQFWCVSRMAKLQRPLCG
jgi:hypothetical protein